MKWIFLVLALIFFILLIAAIDTSVMVIRTRWNWPQKVKCILMVWLIPFYGIYLVRKRIRSEMGIQTMPGNSGDIGEISDEIIDSGEIDFD